MSPYSNKPRRYFSNKMFSPYFQTDHYQQYHADLENKIEKKFFSVLKFFIRKVKKK